MNASWCIGPRVSAALSLFDLCSAISQDIRARRASSRDPRGRALPQKLRMELSTAPAATAGAGRDGATRRHVATAPPATAGAGGDGATRRHVAASTTSRHVATAASVTGGRLDFNMLTSRHVATSATTGARRGFSTPTSPRHATTATPSAGHRSPIGGTMREVATGSSRIKMRTRGGGRRGGRPWRQPARPELRSGHYCCSTTYSMSDRAHITTYLLLCSTLAKTRSAGTSAHYLLAYLLAPRSIYSKCTQVYIL